MWEVLGVSPKADEAAIRKAYADRLKQTNPEDDAEGFKRLRAAYESALRHAKWRVHDEGEIEVDEDVDVDEGEDDGFDSDEDVGAAADHRRLWQETADWTDAAPTPEGPSQEYRRALEKHMRARATLFSALQAGAAAGELALALDAVLHSEAMQQIELYSRTQEWLVGLLHQMRPASSSLIPRVIRFFGWTARAGRVNEWSGPASLFQLQAAIAEDERTNQYLERVRDRRHEFHRAYRQTSKGSAADKRGWLQELWSLRHLGVIGRFLRYTTAKFPDAMRELDQVSVQQWSSRVRLLLDTWRFVRNAIGVALILGTVIAISTSTPPARQAAMDNPGDPLAARRSCRTSALSTRYLTTNSGPDTFRVLRSDCAHALTLMPDSISIRVYAGLIELSADDPPMALDAFRRARALSPFDPAAYYGTALAYAWERTPSHEDRRQIGLLFDALQGDARAVRLLDDFVSAERNAGRPRAHPLYDAPPRIVARPDQSATDAAYGHFGLDPIDANVRVECLARATSELTDCIVVSESPPNLGAAEVAVRLAGAMKVEPATLNGMPVDGVPVAIPFSFVTRP